MSSLIICGFPGIGKSSFYNKYKDTYTVLDSDSSKFDKTGFPANYIEHIKSNMDTADIIMVSSHEQVRDALVDNNIPFTLVYPLVSLKDEYIERYKQRGSPEGFIKLLDNNWYDWIIDCSTQDDCKHVVLKAGQFLTNLIVF